MDSVDGKRYGDVENIVLSCERYIVEENLWQKAVYPSTDVLHFLPHSYANRNLQKMVAEYWDFMGYKLKFTTF